jgi:hypothetical protein
MEKAATGMFLARRMNHVECNPGNQNKNIQQNEAKTGSMLGVEKPDGSRTSGIFSCPRERRIKPAAPMDPSGP